MSFNKIRKSQINAAENAVIKNLANKGLVTPEDPKITMKTLFEFLIKYGGQIISSNDLHPFLIQQAVASNRMYVDENSFGFVWEPSCAGRFPENEKEIEILDWCYPLPADLPQGIQNMGNKKESIKQNKIFNQADLAQVLRKETGASLAECKKIIEANPIGNIAAWKDDLRKVGRKF